MKIDKKVLLKVSDSDILDKKLDLTGEDIRIIGEGSCSGLSQLRYFYMPDTVEKLADKAFYGTDCLNKIKLSSNITEIGFECFYYCFSLQNVELPDTLKTIGNGAFGSCCCLSNIKLPENLEIIGKRAFEDCQYFTSINLPNSLKELGDEAFFRCNALKEVVLSNNMKELKAGTFKECASLKDVKLPENLEVIGDSAFEECRSLEHLDIPASLRYIGKKAFANCKELNEIRLPISIEYIDEEAFDLSNFKYLVNNGKEIIFTNDAKCKGEIIEITPKNSSYIPLIAANWEQKDKIMKDCKKSEIRRLYSFFSKIMPKEKFSEFVANNNHTFFKQTSTLGLSDEDFSSYVKLYYSLGGFNSEPTTIRKEKKGRIVEHKINYAQKVGEFIKEKTFKDDIYLTDMRKLFPDLKLREFDPDLTNFLIDNFRELMVLEDENEGFIQRCINSYDDVQRTNTSNKGSQLQLKPTVDKFQSYFALEDLAFEGVDDSNRDIAITLSKYLSSPTQEEFETALKIDRERKEMNTPDNIISQDILDKYDTEEFRLEGKYFEIEKLLKQVDREIKDTVVQTLRGIISTSDKMYSYEWLNKSSAINYVLGKTCNCCAHLQSAGFGIMHASIVHPSVQNLVIKDNTGKIVAKSTLYVNRDGGYGVCNNVEVSHAVPKEDYIRIYSEFKKGIANFARLYNIEHPNQPLKQINVGMNLNDLSDQIRYFDKRTKVLEAIDYGEYGKGKFEYHGDSYREQYRVWKLDKKTVQGGKTPGTSSGEKDTKHEL